MIPKIIHQLWIGTKPPPTKFMDTWRDKNPDFEYIRWNEEEISKRNLKLITEKFTLFFYHHTIRNQNGVIAAISNHIANNA